MPELEEKAEPMIPADSYTPAQIPVQISAAVPIQTVTPNPLSDNKRENTKDWFNYCMSHRDYEINVYDLNENRFVSDIPADYPLNVTVYPSCNFSKRIHEGDIRGIVIHYTNGDTESSYSWWQREYPGTSAHYLINRDGSVIQSVPEAYTAYHLGCYWEDTYCKNCPDELCDNSGYFYDPVENTIAIELENAGPLFPRGDKFYNVWNKPVENTKIYYYTGNDPLYHASKYYQMFTDEQLASLRLLIASIESRYGDLLILGHSDIQQVSVDPGPAFPREDYFTTKISADSP